MKWCEACSHPPYDDYVHLLHVFLDPCVSVGVGEKGWKLVGDNLDLTVKVRDMRQDNQNESYHFFHTIAVEDRIDTSHLESSKPQQLASQLITSDFVLSSTDYNCLREDFIVLVARVLVHEFEQFKFLADGVRSHIPHKFSEQMASKSTVVCCICHFHESD